MGEDGWRALRTVAAYAKSQGLLVVLDAKRGDIGETSSAYAEAYLGSEGPFDGLIDCLTLHPYLGPDNLAPFVDVARRTGKGVFVCVRTSNPGAAYIQNLIAEGLPIYAHLARLVAQFAEQQSSQSGYSDVGAVVGATCQSEAAEIRVLLPKSLFLVPGMGAQGGSLATVLNCFDTDGMGAIVSSSRAITYPPGNYSKLSQLSSAVHEQAKQLVISVQSCRTQLA